MSINYPGIDYSGPGSTANRDLKTGMRYGVISQNSIDSDVMSDIWNEARDLSYESEVEEMKREIDSACDLPHGESGASLVKVLESAGFRLSSEEINDILAGQSTDDRWDVISDRFNDRYECDDRSWLWEQGGYELSNCLQNDVFVAKSPYFTFAQFCSPCCPGAGNLDHPFEGKAVPQGNHPSFGEDFAMEAESNGFPAVYCLGHDFFEGEKAPYRVFSVETGKIVETSPREPGPV